MAVASIYSQPLHLGLGATASIQPAFTGIEWYADYVERTASDGVEGRLVSHSHFTADWTSWEMHPAGEEVVLCISGSMTVHQELADGSTVAVTLHAGDYAINPAGCWHTADVATEASALFITPGAGTQHRPR